jgi:hypothetical protein
VAKLPAPSPLTGEFLVLGEGDRDVALVNALIDNRTIRTKIHTDFVGGQGGFKERLEGYSGIKGWKRLKGVLLISDNDASSGKSFQRVKGQLNDGGFPSPPRPLEIARKGNMPPLAVLMLPYPSVNGSDEGCLETLTIPALESADQVSFGHVNTLLANCNVGDWPKKGSRDKVLVRCNISVRWPDDPMIGLQIAFGKGLVPWNHAIFNDVAYLLSSLEQWFSSGMTWANWIAQNPRPA